LLEYSSKEEFLSATGGMFLNCFGEGEDIEGMGYKVQAMEIGTRHTFTYRLKTKYGEERWFRGYTYKYEDMGTDAVLCFCMDISDIIALEMELKKQKTRLEFANAEIQTVVGNIPGGVHRCPLFGKIHVDYVSQGLEELSGYTKEDIHSLFKDNYALLLLEEDRSAFKDSISIMAREPSNRILEYRMCKKDGTIIRVVDHFRSVRMEDGRMWGFGVATDVTQQHKALAQLQLLTDSIPGGLGVYEYANKRLTLSYFSDGVCSMVGYTRDEYEQVARTNMAQFTFQEDLAAIHTKLEQIARGEDTVECVYRHRTKNGGYRWLTVRGTVADRWGEIIRINAVLLDITEEKEAEEKLRIRDEEYSLAIKHSGKIVYRYTIADKSVHMLQKSTDPFGFPDFAENVPQSIVALGIFAPESIDDLVGFYDDISKGEKTGSAVLHRRLEKGGFGWCRAHFTTLFGVDEVPISAVISIEDVTKQHEQEIAFERMSQHVARLSKDAMMYFETNLTQVKITRAGGLELGELEYTLEQNPSEMLEKSIDEMLACEDKEHIRRFFSRDGLLEDFAQGRREKETEVRIFHACQAKWVSITVELVADPYTEDVLAYILFRDINKTKTKEMDILKQAQIDGLTKLYNRAAMEEKIKQALKGQGENSCALVIVDIDNLKTINDTLGHIQGDRAIQGFADVLQHHFVGCSFAGRIGGDEFLVFIQGDKAVNNLENTLHTLVAKIGQLKVGEKQEYPIHGSVGAAVNLSGKETFEMLYKQADMALYYVKRHGKNNCAVYPVNL
ncbi:MAG: diguanylate cyclase, partial [Oscillospiraceae bacterium]